MSIHATAIILIFETLEPRDTPPQTLAGADDQLPRLHLDEHQVPQLLQV